MLQSANILLKFSTTLINAQVCIVIDQIDLLNFHIYNFTPAGEILDILMENGPHLWGVRYNVISVQYSYNFRIVSLHPRMGKVKIAIM